MFAARQSVQTCSMAEGFHPSALCGALLARNYAWRCSADFAKAATKLQSVLEDATGEVAKHAALVKMP
jgi:hypothetical protein